MRNKILFSVTQVILSLVVFLLPFVFLPFFTDAYDFGKQVFLLVASFLVFTLWGIQVFIEKKLTFRKNRYLTPAILILAVFLASTFINSSNKMQSFLSPTGTGAVILALIVFLLVAILSKRKPVILALVSGSLVLSIVRIVLFFVNTTSPIVFPSLNLALTKTWSPNGSLLGQALFALIVIPLGFALMYEYLKQQKLALAGMIFLANTLNLIGLGLGFYLLTTIAKPIFLPQGTAWSIAVEGLKTARFAVLGFGPGEFANAFTAFKPLSFNASTLWNARFGVSSNWYFQLLTEVGLLGLAAYLFFAGKILKDTVKAFRQPRISYLGMAIYLSLVILLIVQLFMPFNFFLLALVFILAGIAHSEEQGNTIDFSGAGNTAYFFLIFPVITWGFLFFFAGKVALADSYFLGSLKASSQNDGVKTYNLQIKAINTNKSLSNYHIAYSQTNFALANALAGKQSPTDQDRAAITQLIQQAIREAKSAVTLDPRNVNAWENLAGLYRSLINFAQGADQWAVSAYQQAITLDPLNPRLRVDLGGLYYSQKNWIQAGNLFLQAANLKNDYANAHYNLANALREAGNFQDSAKEYEVTQTLVTAGSVDYQKVTQELTEVQKRIPTPTPLPKTTKTETLSTPVPPEKGLNPPLNLPNEGPAVSPTP